MHRLHELQKLADGEAELLVDDVIGLVCMHERSAQSRSSYTPTGWLNSLCC